MENCSSGEEQLLKARKPYTITKQRERWTDEEHNRFLEALKLYGRAWQRIEEHIGTKTAVQIRSHAQKFFTKLEKEAASKGIPMGQAFNIDIPPPRPKRKPNNPYPRKICTNAASLREEQKEENQSASDTPSCTNTEAVQIKDDSLMQKFVGRGHTQSEKDLSENVNCPDVVTVTQNTSFASGSSLSGCSQIPLVFREFIPLVKEMKGRSAICETSSTSSENEKPKECYNINANLSVPSENLLDKAEPLEKHRTQEQKNGALSSSELQGVQKNTKRAPIYPSHENNEVYGPATDSEATKGTTLSSEKVTQVSRDQLKDASVSMSYKHHASSSVSSIHQQMPCFPPLANFCNNQDGHKSLFNISSTFSSFIISALLQNPAAHAAANLAASFWPGDNEKTSTDFFSEILDGRIPQRHENSSPNIAAIAAATVAAATAWWATHGLHFCHPPFPACFGYTFPPFITTSPTVANPFSEVNQISKADANRDAAAAETVTQQDQQCLHRESAEALLMEHSGSKSSPMASSDSEESGYAEQSLGLELKTSGISEPSSAPCTEVFISNKFLRSKRKRDCQFLVTNMALSNQEQEYNALEKLQESDDQRESVYHHEFGENCNSRLRNIDGVNESWKEVSEKGRSAFRALFSREVLPQSFSEGLVKNDGMTVCYDRANCAMPEKFNTRSRGSVNLGHDHVSNIGEWNSRSDHHLDSSLTMGKCTQNRVATNLKGFKPYKRCSMEAKESRVSVRDENNNKRINVDGKSSTQ